MNSILILDLETSGLDPKTDHVVEIGAALWSVKERSLVCAYSTIVQAAANAAAAVNGIPEPLLASGRSVVEAWKLVGGWVARADAIVGHNVEDFDRLFAPAGWDQGKPWIDTMTDIAWPRESGSKSLTAIALAHGLGVASAHRALTDVLLLARLLERAAEFADVEAMLVRGLRPKALFQAVVSYDDREKAKAEGFRWDAPSKRWIRRMAIEDVGALPFQTRRVDP